MLLGLLLALGLLYWQYAKAQDLKSGVSSESIAIAQIYSSETILFNTTGYPEEPKSPPVQSRKTPSLESNPTGYSSRIRCSCVLYAKTITGYSTPVGAARNWPVNSQTPTPGAVVVFTSGRYGHVAVVLDVARDGSWFTVTESNFPSCTVRSGRVVLTSNPYIKGFAR